MSKELKLPRKIIFIIKIVRKICVIPPKHIQEQYNRKHRSLTKKLTECIWIKIIFVSGDTN